MIQVAIVKPTILSVCIWARIIHTLVVIYVSFFGRVKFLWSIGYLTFYLWNCLIISILFANSNETMCLFVMKLMSLQ
jgi:hypothetical protein